MLDLPDDIKAVLQEKFQNRVSFDDLERRIYAHDMAAIPEMVKPLVGNPIPGGIVQPADEAELLEIIKLALENDISLTPRGKATSGYGGVLPVGNGLVVEFNRMKQIHDINEVERTATVDAGVVWNELEYHLNQKGLTLVAYPTSAPSSTVGGWLAQGGAGIGSFEYGYFLDNVVDARLVQPDGKIRDLQGRELMLLSGANGITGFISRVKLRVKPQKPMHISAVAFESAENMSQFVKGLYDHKVPLWSVSFINPAAARMKNKLPPPLASRASG